MDTSKTVKSSLYCTMGFAYIGALVLVVVSGIALTTASAYWSTIVKREKEEELLFRGDRIRRAIQLYYDNSPNGRFAYPERLQDLLKDPRFIGVKRYIRKIYKDPMTHEGEWELILDNKGHIKGVYSKSKDKPLKTGGFPQEYSDFEKARSYSDWKFVYIPEAKKNMEQKK